MIMDKRVPSYKTSMLHHARVLVFLEILLEGLNGVNR